MGEPAPLTDACGWLFFFELVGPAPLIPLLHVLRHSLWRQVISDFTELFEGGFEVVNDFLSQNIGIGKAV